MEIKFENIILRDMIESDIEDYVRCLPPKPNGQRPMLRGSLSNQTMKLSAHLGKNTMSL